MTRYSEIAKRCYSRMRLFLICLTISLMLFAHSNGALSQAEYSNPTNTPGSYVGIDVDGNGEADALTDGLLILRSMFGLSAESLVMGVVGTNAEFTSSDEIENRILNLGNLLDIDQDSNVDALTDGLLILRYLFGLTGDEMIDQLVSADAERVLAADIEQYLAKLVAPPPSFTSDQIFSSYENQTEIGTVAASDTLDSSFVYSVLDEEISVTAEGVLSFNEAPDYESKNLYQPVIGAFNGITTGYQRIEITILDVDDTAPVFSSSTEFSADENQSAIGRVTSIDVDTDDTLITYSVSGDDLTITSDGILSFVASPDYEIKTSYSATITATDGVNSSTQDITVLITDVDDTAPVFASSTSFSADENQLSIGRVTATDVDTDDALITFSVSGSELDITAEGLLTFASAPDYEIKTSYSATITATDGVNSSTQDITVAVIDVNEPPIFSGLDSEINYFRNVSRVSGDWVFDSAVIDLNSFVSDPENDAVTLSFSGTDSSYFEIDSTNGLFLSSFEQSQEKSIYQIVLSVTDGLLTTDKEIAVSVSPNDTMVGGSGDDEFNASDGSDVLTGWGGDDTFIISNKSGNWTDTINGGAGTNVLKIDYASNGLSDFSSVSIPRENGSVMSLTDANGGKIEFTKILNWTGELRWDGYVSAGNRVYRFVSDYRSEFYPWEGAYGSVYGFIYKSGSEVEVVLPSGGMFNPNYRMNSGFRDIILSGTETYVVKGSSGAEILKGGYNSDTLTGGEGDDALAGGGGSDAIEGGPGDDVVYLSVSALTEDEKISGGEGSDTLSFYNPIVWDNATYDSVVFDLTTDAGVATGFENIAGSSGSDNLTGDTDDNVIIGANGNDIIFGGNGDDTLFGDRHISQNNQKFGVNTAHLNPTGDDILYGGDGNDTIVGNDGDDLLDGGIGSDILTGDGDPENWWESVVDGSDTFVIRAGDGSFSIETADIITDFSDGVDVIAMDGFSFEDLTVYQGEQNFINDVVVQLNSGEILVVIRNIEITNITAIDFGPL